MLSNTSAPKGPQVLIVRLSAMGDIVMASGLPSSLKQHFDSHVTISWLVESPYASLAASIKDVDNVILWPKQEWRKLAKAKRYITLIKTILQFRRKLKSYQFDLVVDAQGLLKSAVLAWFTGARKRLGFISKEKSQWLLTKAYEKPISDDISSEYKLLARQFSDTAYQLALQSSEQDRARVKAVLSEQGITSNYVAIAPFTTRPQKHWLAPYWQDLITQLGHAGHQVVILGGPADTDEAAHLSVGAEHCINLAGSLSLTESAAAIEMSQGIIGVDTGLSHMGIAFNKPTVAIFGSTRPYTYTQNPLAKVLYAELECAPCKRRPTCNGRFDCMQAIPPEQVLSSFEALI